MQKEPTWASASSLLKFALQKAGAPFSGGLRLFSDYSMKISLVIEDAGAGPQVIFSSTEPADARAFFKGHANPGKLILVCNPTPDNFRTIRGKTLVETFSQMPEVEAPKPAKRAKETLI